MKFTCNRDLLREGLDIVSRAIPAKSNYAALECVLIEVSEDLILTGSDNDISITYQVAAIIEEIGSVLVNARIFSDIVRKLPDIYVTVETSTTGNGLHINSGASHFEISTIGSEQYPKVNFINDFDKVVNLPGPTFRSLVKQTAFAASQDSAKMILRGVLIENKGGLLKFVAIDGFKLAVKSFPSVSDEDFRVVVPSRVLDYVAKVVDKNNDVISFCYSENQIMFFNNTFKLVSSLLRGEFPDYERLIPMEFATVMTLPTALFIDTIERVALVIDDDKKWSINLNTYPDEVFVSVAGEDGNSHETLNAEITGQEMAISFNKKNLLDCLKVIEKEKVSFNFSSQKGPCVINSEDDDSFLMLLMPMKTRVR